MKKGANQQRPRPTLVLHRRHSLHEKGASEETTRLSLPRNRAKRIERGDSWGRSTSFARVKRKKPKKEDKIERERVDSREQDAAGRNGCRGMREKFLKGVKEPRRSRAGSRAE